MATQKESDGMDSRPFDGAQDKFRGNDKERGNDKKQAVLWEPAIIDYLTLRFLSVLRMTKRSKTGNYGNRRGKS